MVKPIYEGSEWSFEKLAAIYDACEEIAFSELNLDIYKNQLEVISSDQMLDAYASIGLPIYYRHWSFGKKFIREERNYRKGLSGLAYELVINSNPCINYLMEENSMTTQATVIAHAAFGHNHFFKNNYLFKLWTNADHIIDYLVFAKNYLAECEEKYGMEEVEQFLDSCHALSSQGINKYKRPSPINAQKEKEKQKERQEYLEQHYNDLWRTIPTKDKSRESTVETTVEDAIDKLKREKNKNILEDPEENILYFLEKNSPILKPWQREVIRIVRKISQYFYPQYQTKVMNEGFACLCHYTIMNRLYDKKLITEGSMLEFLSTHSAVVRQPDFDDPSYKYVGLNPYYLGFEMFKDIQRVCINPTETDKELFPDFAGNNDWVGTVLDAVKNYRDESFVRQFLSHELVKKMRLFVLNNNTEKDHYLVKNIHTMEDFRQVRDALAKRFEVSEVIPDIQITDVNLQGNRTLRLTHYVSNGRLLKKKEARKVLTHVQKLWGYKVQLNSVSSDSSLEWLANTD